MRRWAAFSRSILSLVLSGQRPQAWGLCGHLLHGTWPDARSQPRIIFFFSMWAFLFDLGWTLHTFLPTTEFWEDSILEIYNHCFSLSWINTKCEWRKLNLINWLWLHLSEVIEYWAEMMRGCPKIKETWRKLDMEKQGQPGMLWNLFPLASRVRVLWGRHAKLKKKQKPKTGGGGQG